jgi:hypothetical protein
VKIVLLGSGSAILQLVIHPAFSIFLLSPNFIQVLFYLGASLAAFSCLLMLRFSDYLRIFIWSTLIGLVIILLSLLLSIASFIAT